MWLIKTKAAPVAERKSLGDPTAELLELFGAISSGSSIGNAEALTVPAVSAAVRLISEAVASLDVKVKRKVGETEIDAPEHPAHALLTRQANGWTSGFELIRDLVGSALTKDAGGLAYVTKVNGEPREIIQYRDSIITVDFDDVTNEPRYRVSSQPVQSGNIVHIRGPFSRSPLSMAKDAISAAKAMERYSNALWTNSAKPGGYIKVKKQVGDSGAMKMLAAWKAAYGTRSYSSTRLAVCRTVARQLLTSTTSRASVRLRIFGSW